MSVSAMISRVQNALESLDTDCPMENIADLCPEVTHNDVVLALRHLSRTGQVRVTLNPDRTFRVHVCRGQRSAVATHPVEF